MEILIDIFALLAKLAYVLIGGIVYFKANFYSNRIALKDKRKARRIRFYMTFGVLLYIALSALLFS